MRILSMIEPSISTYNGTRNWKFHYGMGLNLRTARIIDGFQCADPIKIVVEPVF